MLNRITEIKLELLCRGIRVSEEVLNHFPGYRYKRASLSEGLCFDLRPEGCARPVPVNLAVHEKFVKKSPFTYDEKRGIIQKNETDFIRADIIDYPSWYKNKLKDGTLFQEVFQIHYHTILATSLTNFCEYKEKDMGCRFCAMGYRIDRRRIKSPEHIKEVLYKLIESGAGFTEINLNSGTLINEQENVNQYLITVKAIREVTSVPVYAQICPPENFSFIDQLAEAGVTSMSFNIEIFDKKIREEMMPIKGHIPVERYLEALEYAGKKLGPSQVSSWLIAGLEPAESTIEAIRQIAGTGAVPFVTVFRPLTGSSLDDLLPPEPEEIAPVFEALGETLTRMRYKTGDTSCGCVKCNCCSAITEVLS